MLSVNAKPFHPTYHDETEDIPSDQQVTTGNADTNEAVNDKQSDDEFSPSAQEAAELEEVEAYVEMMANLAHLEEEEEMTRLSEVQ